MSRLTERYAVTSNPLRTERRVELAVVLLVLVLVIQLLWGVYVVIFPSVPQPILPTPDSLQVGSITDFEQMTPEQRLQVLQRPVFWESRQPLEESPKQAGKRAGAGAQKEKKPGEISGVKLSGVFGAGDSAGIIVLTEGKKQRLMVGEEIRDWKLVSVTPVEARFRNKGERASLRLDRGEWVSTEQSEPAPAYGADQKTGGAAPAPVEADALGLGGGSRARNKKTKKQ